MRILFTFSLCFILFSTFISSVQSQNGGTANVPACVAPSAPQPRVETRANTKSESKAKTSFSKKYRERFNSANYKERNNGSNFRETAIQEGKRRRNERNNGDYSIRYGYAETGTRLTPPLRESSGDSFVELDSEDTDSSIIYHSGRGMRLHLPKPKQRQNDPLRQERIRSMMNAPSLLQRFSAPLNVLNTSQPLRNNRVNNRVIPPVHQVDPQLDFQPQASINVNQTQRIQQNPLPAPQRRSNVSPFGAPNQNGILPFPYSNLQKNRIGVQQKRLQSPLSNQRLNQRDPRLNSRYQKVAPKQNETEPPKKKSEVQK